MKSFLWSVLAFVATILLPISVLAVVVGFFLDDPLWVHGIIVGVGLLVFAGSIWVIRKTKRDFFDTLFLILFPWW